MTMPAYISGGELAINFAVKTVTAAAEPTATGAYRRHPFIRTNNIVTVSVSHKPVITGSHAR